MKLSPFNRLLQGIIVRSDFECVWERKMWEIERRGCARAAKNSLEVANH